MSKYLVIDMKNRRGPIELRMLTLESIDALDFSRSSIAAMLGVPWARMKPIMAELERNKLVYTEEKRLFLTTKGKRIISRYNRLVRDINIRTIY